MASFRFEASNAAGRIEQGVIEADSARAARTSLRARGLVPLAVDSIAAGRGARPAPFRRRRFSESELALATRQLSSLIAARLPLATALAATIEGAEDTAVREVLSAVRSEVVAGHRLADALGQFPLEFPEVYRATVAAGETLARFDGVLRAARPASDGAIRDTAAFSILEAEWPAVRANLEARLKQ